MAVLARSVAHVPRQDAPEDGAFTVAIDCTAGNEYDGRIGLRISAIFVIFTGSMLGCIFPLILARFSKKPGLKSVFFAARFFGSGVIIATALMHLLAPAIAALYSPCLNEGSAITEYAWPEAICLMSIFAMFLAELLANHYVARANEHAANYGQPSLNAAQEADKDHQVEGIGSDITGDMVVQRSSENPEVRIHVHNEDGSADAFSLQMTKLFILEFGIIFHSALIGVTLAVSGEEFIVLYIVLTFHQTFEGVGLGARLALIPWSRGRAWLPYVLSTAYSLSTPVAMAIGLGVRETLEPGSHLALVVSGVFDSVSAGILLYTGLVELIAYDFFSSRMVHEGLGHKLGAFGWMCLGAGLMALLGNWA
ncbi:hypothetical protein S7711_09873 [Stachybotrys chartarum IBT 7711]|uniref:ZIP zinc/iron transport family n=1 Tax=Stachybotrys chartarum (strain CBS 109288 / IBT 7711) TaxID=1280523 RepID=A0A084AXL8_STACB|nr:hypothetical protein S7711_09873 [Stachybotrys chartarum IBT 7711]KFA72256.1 hypothetical protein S40288_10015 [Stachybotrys chartarum IBT 40288]